MNFGMHPGFAGRFCLAILMTCLGRDLSAADLPELTDVFIGGTGGYTAYRIPSLTVTPAGTLLAICEGRKNNRGDRGNIDLVSRRSTDQGKTWEPMQLVHEEGGDAKIVIGNPCPVVDHETKTVWLPFTRNNLDVFVTHSRDDGRTWSPPREITKDVKLSEWGWYATGPGNGIQLARGPHRGRLVIPCDHRIAAISDKHESARSHVIYSDDHGQSWKLGGFTEPKMNECAVVELSDGRLLLNMRSFRGNSCRAVSISKEGGLTWSSPVDDPALVESACQGSLIAHDIPPNGRPDLFVFSNPAVPRGRNHLTLRVSRDGGRSWPAKRVIYEGMSAYSSLASLPDGTIGILFERDSYQRISLARVSIDSLKGPSP